MNLRTTYNKVKYLLTWKERKEQRMKTRTELYKFQRKGVNLLHYFDGRAVLADEMGLGKTVQSLVYADEANAWPALVIVPADLKINWDRECWKHIGKRAHILEGLTPPRRFRLMHPIVIINYDILRGWMEVLTQIDWKILVADEAHKLVNRDTLQSKLTVQLGRRCDKILLLTGTPMMNKIAELFVLLNLVRPDVWPSFHSFAERHCRPVWKPWGRWEYKGAENLDVLHHQMKKHCLVRRLYKDVFKDLPKQTRITVPVTLSREDMKEYREAETDFIGWLTKKSLRLALKARSAERLVRMNYLRQLVTRMKVGPVVKWIEEFVAESDEKLMIFSPLNESILVPLYERYRHQSLLVTGKVSSKKRQYLYDQFNEDKHIRFLFGNTIAAGKGWNCYATGVNAHAGLCWNPASHNQADKRAHGIGRGKEGSKSRAYYLATINTIEEDICLINQTKQRHFNAAIEGRGKGYSFDLFDELEKRLLRRRK
jgi:SNF2 family DNA or RNA helicase